MHGGHTPGARTKGGVTPDANDIHGAGVQVLSVDVCHGGCVPCFCGAFVFLYICIYMCICLWDCVCLHLLIFVFLYLCVFSVHLPVCVLVCGVFEFSVSLDVCLCDCVCVC